MTSQAKQTLTETETNFLELLHDFDTATIITRGGAGELHGRPMAIAKVEDDGALWFLTDIHSPKMAELTTDPRVMVSLANASKFVVANGEMQVVLEVEKARELWKDAFKLWFKGPDDPNLALLRFTPSEGEYWNDAGAQGIKQAFRAASAYIKGEQLKAVADPGIHGKVGG